MVTEQFRILIQEAVIGVRVDSQVRIRKLIGKDPTVPRGHHCVVVADGDERGMGDTGQPIQLRGVGDSPRGEGGELGVSSRQIGRRIPIFLADLRSAEVSHALGAAFFRTREEDLKGVLRSDLVRARVGVYVVTPAVQPRTALRTRAREHEPTHKPRIHEGQFLRNVTTEREPKDVDLLQTERTDEGDHITCHVGHVVRNDSRRRTDSPIRQQDDFAILGDAIDESRIPKVEVPPKVLQAKQGGRMLRTAESTIDKSIRVDLNSSILRCQLTAALNDGPRCPNREILRGSHVVPNLLRL